MLYRLPAHKGFTLVELMVTISIAAILITIAIPSFTSTISSNRLTSYANEFVAALNFARSEAIKRGQQVTITRLSSTSAQWEGGWRIFVDINGDETFADASPSTPCDVNGDGSPAEDCILRTHSAFPSGVTFRTASGTTFNDYAAYSANGTSNQATGGSYTLCAGSGSSKPQRTIAINSIGRVSVATATGTCP